jgi:hypothetical protein
MRARIRKLLADRLVTATDPQVIELISDVAKALVAP